MLGVTVLMLWEEVTCDAGKLRRPPEPHQQRMAPPIHERPAGSPSDAGLYVGSGRRSNFGKDARTGRVQSLTKPYPKPSKKSRPTATNVLPPHVILLMKLPDRRGSSSLPADDACLLVLAAFVAEWLTDRELPTATLDNPPPLSPDLIAAIWQHLVTN